MKGVGWGVFTSKKTESPTMIKERRQKDGAKSIWGIFTPMRGVIETV
jgi:hypothetical protein